MRLFIGIKTGCGEYLATLQEQLKRAGRGRFTRPENLHITLKFLGEHPPAAVPEICAAIAEAGGEPFELEIGGARMFNRSGILSADVLGRRTLAALASGWRRWRGCTQVTPYKHITPRDFGGRRHGGIPPTAPLYRGRGDTVREPPGRGAAGVRAAVFVPAPEALIVKES